MLLRCVLKYCEWTHYKAPFNLISAVRVVLQHPVYKDMDRREKTHSIARNANYNAREFSELTQWNFLRDILRYWIARSRNMHFLKKSIHAQLHKWILLTACVVIDFLLFSFSETSSPFKDLIVDTRVIRELRSPFHFVCLSEICSL